MLESNKPNISIKSINSKFQDLYKRRDKDYYETQLFTDKTSTPLSTTLNKAFSTSMQDYICHREIKSMDEKKFMVITKSKIILSRDFTELIKDPGSLSSIHIHSFDFHTVLEVMINQEFEPDRKSNTSDVFLLQINSSTQEGNIVVTIEFFSLMDLLVIYYMIKKYRLAALRLKYKAFAPDLAEQFVYNKTNRRGGKMQRMLVVSEKFMFNLELFATEPLWASYLESIKWVKLNKKLPSVRIGYNETLEKKMSKESKIGFYPKAEREFVFTSEEQKRLFLFHIRKNIYQHFDRVVKVTY